MILAAGLGAWSAPVASIKNYPLVQPSFSEVPFQRGMSFTTWGAASFNSSEARAELADLRDLGVEWVCFNVWWVQSNLTSTDVRPGPWTDSAANLSDAFDYAHQLGLKVAFKPMLDTETGQWRSNIEASPEWFDAYEAFVWEQAELAQVAGVELFFVGCEMGNMQVHDGEVRALVAGVRERYDGLVSYAANHDSFWFVTWWDAVDLIGVDAWWPFTTSYDPTLEELVAVWDSFYERLMQFAVRWNRPVFFPEVGLQARDGSNMVPNDNKFSDRQDVGEMALFYESLFRSRLWRAPWFKGVYWWMWDLAEVDPPTETGFQPKLPEVRAKLADGYAATRVLETGARYWVHAALAGFIPLAVGVTIAAQVLRRGGEGGVPADDERKKGHRREAATLGALGGAAAFWATSAYDQSTFGVLYAAYTHAQFLGADVTSVGLLLLAIVLAVVAATTPLTKSFHALTSRGRRLPRSWFPITCCAGALLAWLAGSYLASTPFYAASARTFVVTLEFGLLACTFACAFLRTASLSRGPADLLAKVASALTVGSLTFGALHATLLASPGLTGPATAASLLVAAWLSSRFGGAAPGTDEVPELEDDGAANCETPGGAPRETERRRGLSPDQKFGVLLATAGAAVFLAVPHAFARFTLINFNLALLPWFHVPLALATALGAALLGKFVERTGFPDGAFPAAPTGAVTTSLPPEGTHQPLLSSKLLAASAASLGTFLLVDGASGSWRPATCLAGLLFGGFAVAAWLAAWAFHEARATDASCPPSRVARSAATAMVVATLAFTTSGIRSAFVYVLTFFTFVDGRLVVRTDFGAALDYDVPAAVDSLFLLLAGVLAAVTFAGAILRSRRSTSRTVAKNF
ncbi:MAG: hypothetical protein Kow0069_38070 [Promethearchaeota archaeon]